MFNVLDESLETFLRSAVPLSARDVDVAFSAPDRDWAAGLSRPTVNLFLWDVRRNPTETDGGLEVHQREGARPVRRPPLPRVDCRYLVTAWTSEVRDEHALLGALLQALMLAPVLSEEHFQGAYADVRPLPTMHVALPDSKDTADFWSALGGQLKPGLDLIVTATVDAVAAWPVGPEIAEYDIDLDRIGDRPYTGGPDHHQWSREQIEDRIRELSDPG